MNPIILSSAVENRRIDYARLRYYDNLYRRRKTLNSNLLNFVKNDLVLQTLRAEELVYIYIHKRSRFKKNCSRNYLCIIRILVLYASLILDFWRKNSSMIFLNFENHIYLYHLYWFVLTKIRIDDIYTMA